MRYVPETRRTARRVREEIDEPGLRASIAADVNIVVSTGGTASSEQHVRVRQGRSARTPPDPGSPEPGNPDPENENKEQS